MIGHRQEPEHRRAAQRADLVLPHAQAVVERREVAPAQQGEQRAA